MTDTFKFQHRDDWVNGKPVVNVENPMILKVYYSADKKIELNVIETLDLIDFLQSASVESQCYAEMATRMAKAKDKAIHQPVVPKK